MPTPTLKFLDQTGVGYLWGRIKTWANATFSQIGHTHVKNDITNLKNIDDATKNDGGLMSSTQSTKLAGIATNANNYVLPAASTSLGGVKTSETLIEEVNGLTQVKIKADGTLYYADEHVTSPTNHYNPTSFQTSNLYPSTEAPVTAPDNQYVSVVSGYNLVKDAKGHITGATMSIAQVKNTTYSTATPLTSQDPGSDGLMSSADKTKLDKITNVVNGIYINNSSTMFPDQNGYISITIPEDNANLANGAGYQTATDVQTLIDNALVGAITPKGGCTIAELPLAGTNSSGQKDGRLGCLYNITDSFTTTSSGSNATQSIYVKYIEGNHGQEQVNLLFNAPAGTYPAGTNVLCVERTPAQGGNSAIYAWDIMEGMPDDYLVTSDISNLSTSDISDELAAMDLVLATASSGS